MATLASGAHAPAWPAPPPRVRTIPGALAVPVAAAAAARDALAHSDARARLAGTGSRGIESVCGTRLEAAAELVTQHAARELNAPLPTPHSTDVGEIAVLEDDGTFFYTTKTGKTVADLAAIGQSFYRTHGDDYDCLAVFLASGLTTWLGSPSAIAAAFVVRNDIEGIGMDPYDVGTNLGSASRLQWVLTLNGLHRYPPDLYADISGDTFSALDVIAHEFGHRWLSYAFIDSAGTPSAALLGRAQQHWSFFLDSDASLMEGGNWANPAPDSFAVNGLSGGFGNLDLYLMGLRPAAETDSFFTLHDATDFKPPGLYNETSWGTIGTSCDARAHYWKVSDLEALNGPRVPDAANAPHVFRMGVILVTARGLDATAPDLAELENLRTVFTAYFAAATQGLGAVDASLDSRAGGVTIEHEPLADKLDLDTPVPVAAKVAIAQAGIPIALDSGSPTLFWRLGTAGPFTSTPLAPAATDSFSAALPAAPGYTGAVQYYLYAASDSAGIDALDPPAGGSGPHTFQVGPDLLAPVITHTPITAQGTGLMPVTLLARVTDNVELDSVWVEWGVDGLPGSLGPMTRVGRDSFAVTLGGGLAGGQTLEYQIVARDGSNNLEIHRSTLGGNPPWSLAVIKDWFFDTENGAGGLAHIHDFPSYRDAWHTTREFSSPPGGTAWKCGDTAPLPYPVHLDANLYSPWLMTVEPGTMLRFHHRYELEEANFFYAWDGARVEAQVLSGPWIPVAPQTPYPHHFLSNSSPFQSGSPCWSGSSGGWRSETLDLSAFAPGPARFRFRMLADDFVGYDGWIVDAIRVDIPGDVTAVGAPAPAANAPWPNPASDRLHVQLALPRAGAVDWMLFDLAGRRVATLAVGEFAAGRIPLEAALPRDLRPGLYLARLRGPGVAERVDRIAVVR